MISHIGQDRPLSAGHKIMKARSLKRDLSSEYPDSNSETAPESRRSMVVPVPREPLSSPALVPALAPTVSEALVDALVGLGVQHAFGIFGGGIAPFCRAVSESPI